VPDAEPRILLVGDVMTHVIVRPEGPPAMGSGRLGGLSAGMVASFGMKVDFVAHVGAVCRGGPAALRSIEPEGVPGRRSMSIAASLQRHLSRKHVAYEVVPHPPTMASVLTAQACRVPPERLAKGVVVRTGDRYILAVLPASRRISRAHLKAELGENFAFASENELEQLFEDCAPGAIPPIGECYGLDAVVEPSICGQPDIYFEGGDHATLVHVSQTQFAELTGNVPHARFAGGG